MIQLEAHRRAKGTPARNWGGMPRAEYRAKRRVMDRRWKAKRRTKLAASAKAYYWANKQACDKRNREHARANKDVAVARAAAHKARRLQAEGFYTPHDIGLLFLRQRGRCAMWNCRVKLTKKHVDHIQPLSKGGTNWPRNLQLLCPTCNHRKHAKDPIVWAQENGRLL